MKGPYVMTAGGAGRMAQMEVEAQAGFYPGWHENNVTELLGRWFKDEGPHTEAPPSQAEAEG